MERTLIDPGDGRGPAIAPVPRGGHPTQLTKFLNLRMRESTLEVLYWWCSIAGVPLSTIVREALEIVAERIIDEYSPSFTNIDITADSLADILDEMFGRLPKEKKRPPQ